MPTHIQEWTRNQECAAYLFLLDVTKMVDQEFSKLIAELNGIGAGRGGAPNSILDSRQNAMFFTGKSTKRSWSASSGQSA